MRVLCLGIDGADYDLVRDLLARGKLPTIGRLAGEGVFGPLRSTTPAITPTAWSSFLTGLNPAGHGIFNFTSNPNRTRQRVESAASRTGAPLWRYLGAEGIPSAYVTVPFTYPPEALDGIVVTGYGGPARPAIVPEPARERIERDHPELVTAHHPMAERWWEDFDGYTRKLLDHVDEIAGVCRLCLELEPALGLLAVDFMSSDFAGHLCWHRFDPSHPAHDPNHAGDELVQVYEAVDRACGELIEEAGRRWDEEPTVVLLSDHGMKPIHWNFHVNRWLEQQGWLRYRRRSLQAFKGTRLNRVAKVDQRLARTTRVYGRAVDLLPVPRPRADRAFADVDHVQTRAYSFASGGQVYLGEASGARADQGFAGELEAALAEISHPETNEPAFDVRTKEELFHGAFVDQAPELVIFPRDERIYVDSSRRDWPTAFDRHEHLDPEHHYGYSGHHGPTGILAAAGPGIAPAEVPPGSDITQIPATLLALHGLEAELDGEPITAILAGGATQAVSTEQAARSEAPVYSEQDEALMIERLRDFGYE